MVMNIIMIIIDIFKINKELIHMFGLPRISTLISWNYITIVTGEHRT